MNKIIKLAFLLLLAVSGACTKEQGNTTLQIRAINPSGDPVPGASVTLYKNQTDLTNNANIFDIQFTDKDGYATFILNNASVFYYNIYRTSDCASNAFTKTKTGNLVAGQLNIEKDTVYQVGTVTFKNTSFNSYDVSLNGKLWQTIPANTSISAVMKVANYAVHVKQASGVTGTPIEKDYTANVSSCSTQTVSFP